TATVTGVARGSAVVTITAADPAGLQANQGFNVTVGQSGVKEATVAIFGLRNVEDRSKSINPTNVFGDVAVILDVQNNDETVAGIGLTLNDEEIQCRGNIGADLAASGGQIEVDCFFDTNAVDGECVGMQLQPRYANGEYNLGAFLVTAEGERREVVATQPITLKNSGYVIIAHEAGANSVVSNTTKGLTFYGGPPGEDDENRNSFHACPVSYKGTTVGSMQLGSIHTNTARPDPVATDPQPAYGAGLLSFRRANGRPHDPVDDEAPFTWPISTASWTGNSAVENIPGENEFWIENRGLIKNADGLDVSGEFRKDGNAANTHKEGPFQFDFSAPRLNDDDGDSEVAISYVTGGRRVTRSIGSATGNMFSPGSSSSPARLVVSDVAEAGVGGVNEVIAVGDCTIAANTDSRSSTDFVAGDGMDDIRNIAELPEDDAEANPGDEGGLDCYTAELQELTDAIGNSTWLGNVRIQSAAAFGVDKTPPEVTDVEPEGEVVFKGRGTTASPTAEFIFFDANDPDLETGDEGSGCCLFTPQRYYSGAYRTANAGWSVSSRFGDDTYGGSIAGLDDGAYRLRAIAWDRSTPGNGSVALYSFVKDTKAPTFSLGASPGGAINAGSSSSITVVVSGTIKDANPVEEALLTVMMQGTGDGSSNDICGGDDTTDTELPRSRARKYDLENDTKTIEFSQSVTIGRAPGGGMENLCFNLKLTDSAVDHEGDDNGNESMYSAGNFSVNWGLGVNVTEDKLSVPEGGEATYGVSLQSAPVGDVTVTPRTSNSHVTFTPATLTFTTTDFGTAQTVTVSAVEDTDAVNEATTISHSASGGGYSNVSIASVAVTQADNDATLAVDVDSIDEGVIDTVTVTVELATAATAETTVTLTLTDNVPDDDNNEDPVIAKVGPGENPTATDRTITIASGAKKGTIELEIEVGELDGTRDRRITVTGTFTHISGTNVTDPDEVRITLVNDDS
ncbi:MAG: hypothetical protein OXO55_09430, partial [Gemmatimonadota bacterium]